jgi:hypothetical protein
LHSFDAIGQLLRTQFFAEPVDQQWKRERCGTCDVIDNDAATLQPNQRLAEPVLFQLPLQNFPMGLLDQQMVRFETEEDIVN